MALLISCNYQSSYISKRNKSTTNNARQKLSRLELDVDSNASFKLRGGKRTQPNKIQYYELEPRSASWIFQASVALTF